MVENVPEQNCRTTARVPEEMSLVQHVVCIVSAAAKKTYVQIPPSV